MPGNDFNRLVFNTIIGFISVVAGAWFLTENPLLSTALFIIGVDSFKDAYNIYTGVKPSGIYNIVNIFLEMGSMVMSLLVLIISLKMVVYYTLPVYVVVAFFSLMSAFTSFNEMRLSGIINLKGESVHLAESEYIE